MNAALDFTHPRFGSHRLQYNTSGSTITFAGTFGLPDVEEQRRDQLDFVSLIPVKPFGLPLTVKLSAENLLNDRVLVTQGGLVQDRFEKGIKVGIGLTYTF